MDNYTTDTIVRDGTKLHIHKVKEKYHNNNENFQLAQVFKYLGKICVVVKADIGSMSFHNGYVETNKDINESNKIVEPEITFKSNLSSYGINKDKKFIGFDTGHAWNEKEPESQTFDNVKKRTKKMCEDILKYKSPLRYKVYKILDDKEEIIYDRR